MYRLNWGSRINSVGVSSLIGSLRRTAGLSSPRRTGRWHTAISVRSNKSAVDTGPLITTLGKKERLPVNHVEIAQYASNELSLRGSMTYLYKNREMSSKSSRAV